MNLGGLLNLFWPLTKVSEWPSVNVCPVPKGFPVLPIPFDKSDFKFINFVLSFGVVHPFCTFNLTSDAEYLFDETPSDYALVILAFSSIFLCLRKSSAVGGVGGLS